MSINKATGKSGPKPHPPRDGDKQQARQRINVEVRTGYRPHPNTLPCFDCGHIWSEGERRHEYDHHLGYEARFHYEVQAVCTLCHSKRDNKRALGTHCRRGHELIGNNIIINRRGYKECRECRRAKDRGRRDAAYWRAYKLKRKLRKEAESNGSPQENKGS